MKGTAITLDPGVSYGRTPNDDATPGSRFPGWPGHRGTGFVIEERNFVDQAGVTVAYLWFETGQRHRKAEQAQPAVVFLPGYEVSGYRYAWLGEALAEIGIATLILDPPRGAIRGRERPAKHSTVDRLVRALAIVRARFTAGRQAVRLFVGGHSQGGKIVLEALWAEGAARDPMGGVPAGYRPPEDLTGAFTLGSAFNNEWHVGGHPDKPAGLPLLLIAGGKDAGCTVEDNLAVARQFPSPALVIGMAEANHYGWVGAVPDRLKGEDTVREDEPAFMAPVEQWRLTMQCLTRFFQDPLGMMSPDRWSDTSPGIFALSASAQE